MEVPKLDKIVINMGVGEAKENAKALESQPLRIWRPFHWSESLWLPEAKKSVANFKIREGMAIGCKVTLRGDRMYEFAGSVWSTWLCRVYVTSVV